MQHPQPPPIAKCGQCSYVYWLKDAEVVGEVSKGREEASSAEWRRAEYVIEPSEADYYLALDSDLVRTPKEERIARALAWWKSNEPLRGDIVAEGYAYWDSWLWNTESRREKHKIGEWNMDPAARQANLELLLPLLDMDDAGDRLMKAEVLRQLGRFDEALSALQRVTSADYAWIVDQIRPLCEEKDMLVRLLDFPARSNPFEALEAATKSKPEGKEGPLPGFWRKLRSQ